MDGLPERVLFAACLCRRALKQTRSSRASSDGIKSPGLIDRGLSAASFGQGKGCRPSEIAPPPSWRTTDVLTVHWMLAGRKPLSLSPRRARRLLPPPPEGDQARTHHRQRRVPAQPRQARCLRRPNVEHQQGGMERGLGVCRPSVSGLLQPGAGLVVVKRSKVTPAALAQVVLLFVPWVPGGCPPAQQFFRGLVVFFRSYLFRLAVFV